jgi:hypothetical protein
MPRIRKHHRRRSYDYSKLGLIQIKERLDVFRDEK